MTTILSSSSDHSFDPILHAEGSNYFWRGVGQLSIKTFRNGRSFYNTGNGHYSVDEGNYLLLNQGQEYSITIESEKPVESFCIFFPEGMVEEIYRSFVTSSEQLLDNPMDYHPLTLEFVEKTYTHNVLTPVLFQMRDEYQHRRNDRIWVEEQLHDIAQKLILVHRDVMKEMMNLPVVRTSTRQELYKRVLVGHEFISAYYDQPISLADMSKVACLSPNHFLRTYKQLFGMSPHQYLTEKRLQEAKQLLLKTDKSVTTICLEVGLQSPSTFSGLFSKRFSSSPSQLRQRKLGDTKPLAPVEP
ncbi:helix-turn-helix domain-containing protein [Brevibacillus ginsengisoli]|uniref:helix-turn-helix domain-containing protein n=1 Tax=Brevibacillus ginsengisoli TaxID=363854 RepID=UPI003CE724E0